MIASVENGDVGKVFLNGEDISLICFYADDETGIAHCYNRVPNGNGGTYVQLHSDIDPAAPAEPVVIVKTGKIVIELEPLARRTA